MKLTGIFSFIAAGLIFYACNNNSNNETTDSTSSTTVTYDTNVTVTTPDTTGRGEYRSKLQRQIDSLRMKLNNKISNTGTKTKKDTTSNVRLRAQLDSLQADIDKAGDKTEQEWQDFKSKVNASMDTIRHVWERNTGDMRKYNKK